MMPRRCVSLVGCFWVSMSKYWIIKKDIDKAVKLLLHAAELGSAQAYYNLGHIHVGGINKDEAKAEQYFEKVAMAGCADSRFDLGCIKFDAGRLDRAIKHWLIAARSRELRAVDCIKEEMTDGNATRDDYYAQALRGYELYLDEVKSDGEIGLQHTVMSTSISLRHNITSHRGG
jgi:TPR repeat protein